MNDSHPTSGGGSAKNPRRLELELAKARAEAEEARLRAQVLAMEAELAQAVAVPVEPGSPVRKAPAGRDEQEDGRADRKRGPTRPLARWLENSSGWMVSAVVHAVVVIFLGLISISFSKEPPAGIFLNSTAEVEDAEAVEDVAELQPDLEIEEAQAVPVRLEPMGAAALGELSSSLPINELGNVSVADATDPMADLGALFGDAGRGFAEDGPGKGGATFFGVKAGGRKFVFVVDGSMSMNKNGWELCKQELVYAVHRLKPDQYFYVILFAREPYMMFGDEDPESMLVKATPENISRLEHWLARYELHLGTKPLESMRRALGMHPDAIYFLTDGKIQDDTEGYLKRENKIDDLYDGPKPRVAVHTIGFFTLDGAEVLKRISAENGGTFRYVAEPPGYKQFKKQRNQAQGGGRNRPGRGKKKGKR